MNKKHWNTVMTLEGLDEKFICELIDHSYDMVVSGMSKKQKQALTAIP